MRKKFIPRLAASLLALLLALGTAAGAAEPAGEVQTDASGQWRYVLEDGRAILLGCVNEPEGDLLIPAELDGIPVAGIGEEAFIDCDGITGVIIPGGVTELGDLLFYGCAGLTHVTLPDELTHIPRGMFYECAGLTGITIPGGVTSIGSGAFAGCTGLSGVDLPQGVTGIYEGAFARCAGLSGIVIPDGVTILGDSAFSECTGLSDVEIPDSVVYIDRRAFAGCAGLTGLAVPESVMRIGSEAFRACDRLVLRVTEGSYAEQYARNNEIPYTYSAEASEAPVISAGSRDYDMSEALVPGVSREDFDTALREDRLTLAPVPLPGLPEDATLLSLSPDGSKLLIATGGGLSVYTIADGALLPLTPKPGDKSKLSDETLATMFSAPEVNAISWSADGRFISFSFPRRVILDMLYITNIWIAGLETGAIEPLMDLPETISFRDGNIPDVPMCAMFDPERPLLYYSLRVPTPESLDVQYYALAYETGVTELLGGIPYEMLTGDPALRRVGEALVAKAVYRTPSDGSGLIAMAGGAVPVKSLATGRTSLTAFLSRAWLIDAAQRCTLLECGDLRLNDLPEQDESMAVWSSVHIMECAFDEKGKAHYGEFLGFDQTMPADARLLRVAYGALDDQEAREALALRHQEEEIKFFANAAYSPGGGYTLLSAEIPGCSLYVLNRATDECGRITLPEDFAYHPYAFARNIMIFRHTIGLQWSQGGRLLLNAGEMNRLYELAVLR